jgi:long-chain acyl-CoA synthetase
VRSPEDRAEPADVIGDLPERISHLIHRHAAERPDHFALVDSTESWTYGALAAIVADTAARLRDCGVRPGDRVMIVSENSLPLAALVLANSELDAWTVAANPRLSPRELDQIQDHCQPRRIFYVTAVSPAAQDHAIRHGAAAEPMERLGVLGMGPVNGAAVPEPVEPSGARQVAALVYTSGTTGTPKGVMLTHLNLLYNARVSGMARHLTAADKMYGVLPMSHVVGLSTILVGALMFGSTIQLVPRYDPAELARALMEDGVTMLFGVPATYQRLLEHKAVNGLAAIPRGQLRHIAVAGAPLDLTLKGRVEAEWGLPLLNAYGITECGPGVSAVRAEATRTDLGVGRPIEGLELRLVGEDRRALAPGAVGALHVRSPGVMRGYYKAPELTAAVIDDEGWFNTGDLARFHDDSLFIVGRAKEMIIRSGFNVYPAEVEAVLNTHPAVVQSAVIGRAVAGNEEVVAFVQILPGSDATEGDLMRHAAAQLTAYKRPVEIIILGALPASSTGKILKHRLADAARLRSPA